MRTLRWGTLLALVAVALSILYFGLRPIHRQTFLADSVQSVGHFCVFGAFALLVSVASPNFLPSLRNLRWRQYGVGLLVSIASGALLEIVQSQLPSRSASWTDMAHDSLGAVTGILLLVAIDRPPARQRWQTAIKRAALPLCFPLLAIGLWPLADCLHDYWNRNRACPILLDFDAGWHQRFLWCDKAAAVARTASLPADWPRDRGHRVAEITLGPQEDYPGVGVAEPYPDWHSYRYLTFDLYNPGSRPLALILRVHDFEHNDDQYDRFHRVLTVAPGFQHFRVALRDVQTGPRDRLINLHSVDGVKIFANKPAEPVRFLLGNLQLE